MNPLVRAILLLMLLVPGACSMKTMIERMTSPEDRAFAASFVRDVRRGDVDRLRSQFDPELWIKSQDQLPQAQPLFPVREGETRLVSYSVSTNLTNGSSQTSKNYTLVTTDGAHWTRTLIATYARDGPARVVSWNVQGFAEPPPELQFYEFMDKVAPWLLAGAALILVAFICLIWWLVRRSRRRAAAIAGGP